MPVVLAASGVRDGRHFDYRYCAEDITLRLVPREQQSLCSLPFLHRGGDPCPRVPPPAPARRARTADGSRSSCILHHRAFYFWRSLSTVPRIEGRGGGGSWHRSPAGCRTGTPTETRAESWDSRLRTQVGQPPNLGRTTQASLVVMMGNRGNGFHPLDLDTEASKRPWCSDARATQSKRPPRPLIGSPMTPQQSERLSYFHAETSITRR